MCVFGQPSGKLISKGPHVFPVGNSQYVLCDYTVIIFLFFYFSLVQSMTIDLFGKYRLPDGWM